MWRRRSQPSPASCQAAAITPRRSGLRRRLLRAFCRGWNEQLDEVQIVNVGAEIRAARCAGVAPPDARADCVSWRMAEEGCDGLLPIPCGPGKPRPVACLRAAHTSLVAAGSESSQPKRHAVLGSAKTALCALDSSTPCSASIPDGTFRRHSSEVGAVCIKVHVRFCAGGGQQWPSLPRQLSVAGPNFAPLAAAPMPPLVSATQSNGGR
jgi:hypothetical protein